MLTNSVNKAFLTFEIIHILLMSLYARTNDKGKIVIIIMQFFCFLFYVLTRYYQMRKLLQNHMSIARFFVDVVCLIAGFMFWIITVSQLNWGTQGVNIPQLLILASFSIPTILTNANINRK